MFTKCGCACEAHWIVGTFPSLRYSGKHSNVVPMSVNAPAEPHFIRKS